MPERRRPGQGGQCFAPPSEGPPTEREGAAGQRFWSGCTLSGVSSAGGAAEPGGDGTAVGGRGVLVKRRYSGHAQFLGARYSAPEEERPQASLWNGQRTACHTDEW